MNNRLRLLLLCLLIALTTMVLLFYRKEPVRIAGCPGNDIDMTKMLQYGEKVQDVRLADRYRHIFDIADFSNKPMLLIFTKDNLPNIHAYEDSLYKHLKIFIANGLEIVIINNGEFQNGYAFSKQGKAKIYCDTDNMALFKAFRVYKHSSCIILNKDHKAILVTVKILLPNELNKIIQYKKAHIF